MSNLFIPLTQGKFAVVDHECAALVIDQKWSYWRQGKTEYARCRLRGSKPSRWVTMQMYILPGYTTVDHVDGDGLNNRLFNLRVATKQQNAANRGLDKNNTSGYKGVYRARKPGMFRAAIQVGGKQISLGNAFVTKDDAARAYDEAALKYFKEFAKTNAMLGRLDP